jgi:hypothetical protein
MTWPKTTPFRRLPRKSHQRLCLAARGRLPRSAWLSSVMPSSHRFKIGQVVLYRGDFFRIIGRLQEAGGQPTYRIKHETEDDERVVRENAPNDARPRQKMTHRPGGGAAIGSSSVYIHKVIICQALLKTADTALPIVMRPGLTLRLFLLTVAVCVISAIAAIVQVTSIDPAMVFMR